MPQIPNKTDWPKWMLAAEREIGTRETPGTKTDNPRILEYQRATRLDEQALGDETSWCAAFVSWCLEQGGAKNPRYALARNFLKYGTDVILSPQFGDILVFPRGESWQGHATFFVSDVGTGYQVLGGNQMNSVCYRAYPKTPILGIRRPVVLAA